MTDTSPSPSWYGTLKRLQVFACLVLLLTVVSRHEPWSDEAQAWLQARDASPYELAFHHLRLWGHPALWHAILMVPAKTPCASECPPHLSHSDTTNVSNSKRVYWNAFLENP